MLIKKERLPEVARWILQTIVDQLNGTMGREIEVCLARWYRHSRVSRLLTTVPGVGVMGASAIADTVVDPSLFPIRPRVCGLAGDDPTAELQWCARNA